MRKLEEKDNRIRHSFEVEDNKIRHSFEDKKHCIELHFNGNIFPGTSNTDNKSLVANNTGKKHDKITLI